MGVMMLILMSESISVKRAAMLSTKCTIGGLPRDVAGFELAVVECWNHNFAGLPRQLPRSEHLVASCSALGPYCRLK